MRRLEVWGWIVVAVVLCGLAIPWFLWGDGTVVWGIPLWLWWHVGWMGVASVVFWVFTQRAWGIGIESNSTATDSSDEGNSSRASGTGGERQ
ncbi:DUF3311 domain-containing protein [Natronorubrum daqingense]|uniref:DUF3311 domain-containing protein n=1 Tax=Natronorubrum daqingense TaxID=588898 RepID=A0A1N7A236_9EURY|nr:DUF3311 domain-containing protein [Natronorubrum daqingense]APX95168.1 hypothetical protein BB347_00320 [Natronorubrum daqingense]SIR33118.1 Protein of unknown function [Natronorubrum daqingense]